MSSAVEVPLYASNELPNKAPQEDPNQEKTIQPVPSYEKNPNRILVTIAMNDVTVKVSVPKSIPTSPWFGTPVTHFLSNLFTCGGHKKDFFRLQNVSGIIRPGEMTMILSPPGHGKSTYLKTLAAQLPISSGKILYNGRTRSEASKKDNVDIHKLVQYLEQTDDILLPTLNVYETMTFANQLSAAKYDPVKVNYILDSLGLTECGDVLVGNANLKGISGGQKRRLNTSLPLLSDATVMMLDEFSNGLDSAVTEKIGYFFHQWCRKTGGSMVCTLQQPTPDLFQMFDQLVLLREGNVVYHGPICDVMPFLNGLGYLSTQDIDICDFILNILTEPRITLQHMKAIQYQAKHSSSSSSSTPSAQLMAKNLNTTNFGLLQESPSPCITTEEMTQYYHSTPFYQHIQDEIQPYLSPTDSTALEPLITPEIYDKYSNGFRQSVYLMFLFVCMRELKLILRNIGPLIFRFAMSFFIAWIHASLYYDISHDDYTLRVSSFIVGFTQPTMNQMGTLADAVTNKPILLKENINSMYPIWAYTLSFLVTSIPQVLIEAMIFTLIYYFMQNHYLGFFEWMIYYFAQTAAQFVMAGYFRLAAMLLPDIASALACSAPSALYLIILSGFFVREDYMLDNPPYFFYGIYRINPLAYLLDIVTINQFQANIYNDLIINAYTKEIARKGDVYLYYVNISSDTMWILYGIIYLFALLIFFIIFQTIVVWRPYVEFSRGSQRIDDEALSSELAANNENIESISNDPERQNLQNVINDQLLREQKIAADKYRKEVDSASDDDNDNDNDDDGQQHHHHDRIGMGSSHQPHHEASVSISQHSSVISSQLSQLQSTMGTRGLHVLTEKIDFSPTYLSFTNIQYTVRVTNLDGETSDRILLDGVSGSAQPGRMLALMGASGAGKTTLLDVLAGRKNAGVMSGTILYNGVEATKEQQALLTCYVEQFSSLFTFSTVEETLLYAARLRLPRNVSESIKKQVAFEVMEVLDLTPIRHCIIGGDGVLGLSPSQLKRVSIGVELVANPSILFLDEPTTGLDSKSATVVMRAVKRIARAGRAIICTIHQPSAELFFLFDSLVLLGPGGHQIYYGDLGYRSQKFLQYFSSVPGINPKKNPYVNPANWMLEEASKDIPTNADDTSLTKAKDEYQGDWSALRPTQKWILTLKQYYFENCQEWKNQRQILNRLEGIYYTIHPELKPKDFVFVDDTTINNDTTTPTTALQPLEITNVENQQQIGTANVDMKTTLSDGISNSKRPTWYYQLFWYTLRQSQLYWRNSQIIFIRCLVQALCSIIGGLIFLQIKPTSQANLISYMAALTLTTAGCFANTMGTITPVFAVQKSVQYRERYSGFYSFSWFYCVATYLNEIVWCFPFAVITTIPVYFLVGLPHDAGVFFRYLLATYMVDLVAMSAMTFFVSVSPNQGVSQLFLGCYNSLATAYNGAAIPWPALNGFNKFLFSITPLGFLGWSYLTAALENNTDQVTLIQGTSTITRPVKEYAKEYFGYGTANTSYWACFGYMIIQIIVFQIFFYLATVFIIFNKR